MTGLTSPPYTDEDARVAVDGSNVAVEEANQANAADVASNADNADQLGGYQPSHFETPNSTQTGYRAAWSYLAGDGYGNQNLSPDVVGDQVELRFVDNDSMDYDLYINGNQRADSEFINGGSDYYNVSMGNISSIEIDDVSGDNEQIEVYVRRPAVSPHTLPI